MEIATNLFLVPYEKHLQELAAGGMGLATDGSQRDWDGVCCHSYFIGVN